MLTVQVLLHRAPGGPVSFEHNIVALYGRAWILLLREYKLRTADGRIIRFTSHP